MVIHKVNCSYSSASEHDEFLTTVGVGILPTEAILQVYNRTVHSDKTSTQGTCDPQKDVTATEDVFFLPTSKMIFKSLILNAPAFATIVFPFPGGPKTSIPWAQRRKRNGAQLRIENGQSGATKIDQAFHYSMSEVAKNVPRSEKSFVKIPHAT